MIKKENYDKGSKGSVDEKRGRKRRRGSRWQRRPRWRKKVGKQV